MNDTRPPKILERLPDSRFSKVVPAWKGDTVVIIGGGPSVTPDDVAYIKGKAHCIAVNDAYLLAPWADVQYAADEKWHKWHREGVERIGLSAQEVSQLWANFPGQKCSIQRGNGKVEEDENIHILENRDHPNQGWGLSTNPRAIVTGRNSGFQALNIATLAGAKRVLLMGFDGRPGLQGHWFGEHPSPTHPSAYELYRQAMTQAEIDLSVLGVKVINCSMNSAINSFRKMPIREALC